MSELYLKLDGEVRPTVIETAIVAGWTGRDKAALEEHMAELEALGVPRPSSTPIFYRVAASLVTIAPVIEATAASSGEVEAVLLQAHGSLWVGVGSDHTDRDVETYSVAVSKQMCEKPIAAEFWRYDEVAAHWDQLVLRSRIREDGSEVIYQEGSLASILPAEELRRLAQPPLEDGTVMFCGTLAAPGGIRPAPKFSYELEDPVHGESIEGGYLVRSLPLVA